MKKVIKLFYLFTALVLSLYFANSQDKSSNPDIRKDMKPDLSSTSINYYDPNKVEKKDFKIIEDNTLFSVVEYSPVGELPADIKYPTIYVLFSQPVVPISKLGAPLTSSNIMRLDPDVNGTYRWYGTKLLAFEPKETFMPQKEYSIIVSDGLKSLGGKQLTGNRIFKFHSDYLNINSFYPTGEDVSFDNARKIFVMFNYSVNLDVIKRYIKIFSGGKEFNFTLSRPDKEYKISKDDIDKIIVVNVKENFNENSTSKIHSC